MSLSRPLSFRKVASFAFPSSYRAAALVLALVSAAACGDDPEPIAPPEPVDVVLSDVSITLIRSATAPTPSKQVTADVLGTDNDGVVWKVGDPSVATVSQTGMITAVSDGNTFVTVTSVADPTKNRSVVVNVVSTVVLVTPATDFLYVGGPSRTLTATVKNNTNTSVTWSSSNTAVATVSSTGVITPVAAGTANIVATSVGDDTKQAASIVRVDAVHSGFTALPVNSTVAVSGATGDKALFWVYVPRGTTALKATVAGPNGDADLAVYTANATASQVTNFSGSNLACYSAGGTTNETCTVNNPDARVYYILVDAWAGYTGATLNVTTTP